MAYLHRGAFSSYIMRHPDVLNESIVRTRTFSEGAIHSGAGPMVFISHKHSELEKYGDNNEVNGLLNYLIDAFQITPYIDCFDPNMPQKTCAETAERIKGAISTCSRFILLGTEAALASKWCNWEVGIADKTKYLSHHMAILPMLEKAQNDEDYKGNEYLRLYPKIIGEAASFNRTRLSVVYPEDGATVSLATWLGISHML